MSADGVVILKCDSCGAAPPLTAFRGRLLCDTCYAQAREQYLTQTGIRLAAAELAAPKSRPPIVIGARVSLADPEPVKAQPRSNWLLRCLNWLFGFDGNCKKAGKGGSSDA